MTVRSDRVLPGIAVFASDGKKQESIRVQVSDPSKISAWSRFFLDPSDSLVYFKMCRHLERLKLASSSSSSTITNSNSNSDDLKIHQKKNIEIIKFSTKRRASGNDHSQPSNDMQHMMFSPMKRRRKSFDGGPNSVDNNAVPMSTEKRKDAAAIAVPMSVEKLSNKKDLDLVPMSVEKKKINM